MAPWDLGFLAFTVVKIKGSLLVKSVKSIESEFFFFFSPIGVLLKTFF